MESQNSSYVLEEIEPESHSAREIYALHGLCMYLSQGLERIMSILLAGCYFSRPKDMTAQKYDDRLEVAFRRTFGVTVNEWCRHETDSGLCDRLRKATATRNWLAHRYFWERAGHLVTKEGIEFMRLELSAVRDELSSLDEVFHSKAEEHNKLLGIPEDFLEQEARKIEAEALTHIRSELLKP